MTWFDVFWVFPDDADSEDQSNVDHIARHDLTPEDVEHALENPLGPERRSRTSSRRVQTGFACDGSIIDVVYEWLDDGVTLYPITAFRIDK
jgi:hypothetical protein